MESPFYQALGLNTVLVQREHGVGWKRLAWFQLQAGGVIHPPLAIKDTIPISMPHVESGNCIFRIESSTGVQTQYCKAPRILGIKSRLNLIKHRVDLKFLPTF